MKKSIRLVIYSEQYVIRTVLKDDVRKVPNIEIVAVCSKEEDLIFFLGKYDADFVLAGLSDTKLIAICNEMSTRYLAVNFLLISNDSEQGKYDLKILSYGVYEVHRTTTMEEIIKNINVIHYKKWLIDYSLFVE